jgi:hypothetical protein
MQPGSERSPVIVNLLIDSLAEFFRRHNFIRNIIAVISGLVIFLMLVTGTYVIIYGVSTVPPELRTESVGLILGIVVAVASILFIAALMAFTTYRGFGGTYGPDA